MELNLTLEDVLAARSRLKQHIHKTPLIYSAQFGNRLGCKVYVKAEFNQKTGSFKARGALNYLLTDQSKASTYTTYSSGNHGQALSWAASRVGKKAVIFMPEDASPVKIAGVEGYGGEVRFAGRTSLDRKAACEAFAQKTGAHIVPPFDHEAIIAGQGSAMLETIEDLPVFDACLVPVGGGGLLSGCAFVLSQLRRKTEIYACEPELAADLQAGLKIGERQQIDFPNTIADGVRNLMVGDRNWEILHRTVREGLTCEEADIRKAMRWYALLVKHYVEPSGALSLACLIKHRERFAGKTVLLIASGGNIALDTYAQLVTQDGSTLN